MARVAINTGSVANDGTGDTLRVAGGIINDNFSEIYNQFGDGTTLTPTWDKTDAGINTTSSVGVGTTNPRFTLEVGSIGTAGTSLWINGDARVTGILTVGTASIIIDGSSNVINVGSGITIDGNAGTVSASSINIGGSTLTGAGVTYITAGSGISVDQNTGNVTITATEIYWTQNSTGIHTLSNIGIGTTTASSALTISGDVSVSGVTTCASDVNVGIDTSSGLVLTSPNGTQYRLIVANDGTLSTTAV
jgi:hypothetical protein